MDLKLTPEEEAFRDRLRAWLKENLPAGWAEGQRPKFKEAERVQFLRDWQRQAYEGGWVGIAWPKEYGGMGATIMEQAIYNAEWARAKAPELIGLMGLTMIGPTLMQWGTEEQKARYLPKMLTAEEIWCQGYSEPNAGSDLASLQTRAVEDGDDFVITGQKIWTSNAHFAEWCYLLVRTDPAAPKHKGISYLLVDMKSPGISVRPLVQITGSKDFNEVFFDNVRVPKTNLLGEKNRGWYVGVTTLSFERSGLAGTIRLQATLESLTRMAHKAPRASGTAWDDPKIRQKLAQVAIDIEVLRQVGYRNLVTQVKGDIPGPEASVGKLFSSELSQRIAELGVEILGPYALLGPGSKYAVANGNWQTGFLGTRAMTIAGGTSEIQRNIIGERALGLPK